jgi:hypothetical protein
MVSSGNLSIVSPHDIAADSGGQYSLANAARQWTLLRMILKACGWTPGAATNPSSLPVRVSFKHGTGSSSSELISNPPFYERVMGWPEGWTEPERPVTAFAAWLQRSRGALSELLRTWEPEPTD